MIRNKLIALSWKIESFTLRTIRKNSSVVVVVEFPKSGGTWLAKLLASSLGVPFIHGSFFIPRIPCVIRVHWLPRKDYPNLIYIVRDCRDVMVSLFHHRCKNIKNTPKLNRLYRKAFGEELSVNKIYTQLPDFINIEFQNQLYGVDSTWREHIIEYYKNASDTHANIVKYEDLLNQPVDTIQCLLIDYLSIQIPKEKLSLVVSLHDKKWGDAKRFSSSTDTTFIRQGESGGWKDVYSPLAGKTLAKYLGSSLIDLGYEHDDNWWKAIEERETYEQNG